MSEYIWGSGSTLQNFIPYCEKFAKEPGTARTEKYVCEELLELLEKMQQSLPDKSIT